MGTVTVFQLLVKLSVLIALLAVVYRGVQKHRRLPPVVEGFFLPEYRPVAQLFRKYIEDGTERGGSFAVYHKGEPLIQLWGGYADPDSRRPWRDDTVTMVWSCAKGMAAIAAAKLVEKGLLDYKAPVKKYWPEFAQNGKDNITVEMLLSHQAGLVTLGGESLSLLDYKHDWPKMKQYMAKAAPDFPPGSKVVYHSFTFGMYVDALVRQVDPQHRNMSQFFEEEVARPHDVDVHVGLPKSQYYRAARQFFPQWWEWPLLIFDPEHHPLIYKVVVEGKQSLFSRGHRVLNFFELTQEILNDPLHMEVGQPSLMGFGSAKSLAKLYSILGNGGSLSSKTLLPEDLVRTFEIPINTDPPRDVKNVALLYSMGFQVTDNPLGDPLFGHDGYGGQYTRADLKHNLGIAYTTNFLWYKVLRRPDHVRHMEKVFYECLMKMKDKESGEKKEKKESS